VEFELTKKIKDQLPASFNSENGHPDPRFNIHCQTRNIVSFAEIDLN
jgi:hypothetical protein